MSTGSAAACKLPSDIPTYHRRHDNGSIWVEQRDTTCLYDGWNVMAELDANACNARLRTYVWGTDLSGSAQGAGGVGGLLWVNNYQTTFDGQTLPTGIHFVAYDGNGNVSALVKASDGSVSARYEYGPFAEPVRITRALADAQPIRFSTKWTDIESGFLYYGIGTTIQSEHGEVDEHGQHWGGGRSEPRRVSCERAFGRC